MTSEETSILGKIEGRPAMSWLEGPRKLIERSLDELRLMVTNKSNWSISVHCHENKEVEKKKWASQEKKVCRGPSKEVLIDKFQRRGRQTESPAGAVVKEGAERAAGLPGICASRRHGSLGGEVCLVTTGPAARRTAVTTERQVGYEEVGSETVWINKRRTVQRRTRRNLPGADIEGKFVYYV
ncbi:hypothetical protein LAZ67_6002913 [Cordylochernes scorpioides]|uniref:Uncharacterized protein n=1 Tax=Cordylochernes scorpioides TaxID=51811 RepID=A0ABY6KKT0_9ARAC|nr:hypothetical protein LAZ67_6002913 [Cordylochernes scorpioides]